MPKRLMLFVTSDISTLILLLPIPASRRDVRQVNREGSARRAIDVPPQHSREAAEKKGVCAWQRPRYQRQARKYAYSKEKAYR